MTGAPLDRIQLGQVPAFALLYRPESGTRGHVDVLIGDVTLLDSLAGVAVPDGPPRPGPAAHHTLIVVPYRQITERGFVAPDDGAPLIAMSITEQHTVPVDDLLARLPDTPTVLSDQHFDVADEEYAQTVRQLVAEEIGEGVGANFVIRRSFLARIVDYAPPVALAFFRRLVERERGAYWTFVIQTGQYTFVGATPERHITLDAGQAVMNPISGTYRYPAAGPTLQGVTEFLADPKEVDELYMVVDEELKMMARICESGCRLVGPFLKEMARLAHSEYFIEGRTRRDVREILRETMFAPTVTGSPLESAARVIARYEPSGRGYYSGIAALIGTDRDGEPALDSAILIRTADIDPTGRMRVGVGATIVRHSDPAAEAEETRAKASGLLHALQAGRRLAAHPQVQAALRQRNAAIADFWLRGSDNPAAMVPEFVGLTALVVDAEDTFTAMIELQLRSLGLAVTVSRFDAAVAPDGYDLVVMGPGPGDPRALNDAKIARLARDIDALLVAGRPFIAVCLSHQVLSRRLGLELVRRTAPNQGVQREIEMFGARERVGFYNTFAAHSLDDKRDVDGVGIVEVCRDRDTGEVHALRGARFLSMQFHAESVLTVDGPRIMAGAVGGVLRG